MKVNDVVQFTEEHQWIGCFGTIIEDKGEGHPRRYMIGVPVPMQGQHISLMMGLALNTLVRRC